MAPRIIIFINKMAPRNVKGEHIDRK